MTTNLLSWQSLNTASLFVGESRGGAGVGQSVGLSVLWDVRGATIEHRRRFPRPRLRDTTSRRGEETHGFETQQIGKDVAAKEVSQEYKHTEKTPRAAECNVATLPSKFSYVAYETDWQDFVQREIRYMFLCVQNVFLWFLRWKPTYRGMGIQPSLKQSGTGTFVYFYILCKNVCTFECLVDLCPMLTKYYYYWYYSIITSDMSM